MTKLESFIKRKHIHPKELAALGRISRQHLIRIRQGKMEPTRHVVFRLTMACAIILRRLVDPGELFNLAEIGKDKCGGTQGRRPKRPKRRKA